MSQGFTLIFFKKKKCTNVSTQLFISIECYRTHCTRQAKAPPSALFTLYTNRQISCKQAEVEKKKLEKKEN